METIPKTFSAVFPCQQRYRNRRSLCAYMKQVFFQVLSLHLLCFTPKLINLSYKWCKSTFKRRRICIASVGLSYDKTKGHLIREKYTGLIWKHCKTLILIKLSFVYRWVYFKRLKEQFPQKCKSSHYCFTHTLMERGFCSPQNISGAWSILWNTWNRWRRPKNNMQGLTCSSPASLEAPRSQKWFRKDVSLRMKWTPTLGTFGSQSFCRLLCVLWLSYALKQVLIHLSFFRRMMQKSWKSLIFAWALPQIESSFSILTQRRLKLYSSEIKSVISRKLLKEVHFSGTRLKYSKTFYFCRYFIWD